MTLCFYTWALETYVCCPCFWLWNITTLTYWLDPGFQNDALAWYSLQSERSSYCVLRPIGLITTKTVTKLISADGRFFNLNTNMHNDAINLDTNLSYVCRHITVPTYMQAAVLIGCKSTGSLTIYTHCNVVEHECSMTVQSLASILLWWLF